MSNLFRAFLFVFSLFASSVFAETVVSFDPDTGEQYYSTVQQPPAKSVTQKTTNMVTPAAVITCTGTITNNISITTLPPSYTTHYNFSQSTACNNKYVTMSLTNRSYADLRLGLQRYESGVWKTVLTPTSTLYKSLALPTGTYRWRLENRSTGTNGLYTGYYTVKF